MRALVLFLPALLTGCACFQIFEGPGPAPQPETTLSERPQGTAAVGATLYSETNYWNKTVSRLLEDFHTGFGPGQVAVVAGDLVLKERVNGRIAYCTERPAYRDSSAGPGKSACFIDGDADGKFETVIAAPEGRWLEKAVPRPIRYARTGMTLAEPDSIKHELLYSGISNGSLKLSYREYQNDIARPDSFLEVSYDFRQKPTTISFRTMKIDVFSADNNEIVYRVLKGF